MYLHSRYIPTVYAYVLVQDFVHIYGDSKESCWADDHYERKKGQHSVHLHRKYCVVSQS